MTLTAPLTAAALLVAGVAAGLHAADLPDPLPPPPATITLTVLP